MPTTAVESPAATVTADDTGGGAAPSMRGLVRPHVGPFLVVVVLQAIGALAGLVPLLAVVELGRAWLTPGPVDHSRVWFVVAAGAVGLLVRLVFTSGSSAVGHLLDTRVQFGFRRMLAARLGRVPIGWLAGRRTGELAQVVGDDVSAVHPFIAHTPSALVSAIVVPAASLAYLLTVDWRLTLITLLPVLGSLALLPLITAAPRQRDQEEFDAGMGRIANAAIEFVQGIAVIKSFGGGRRAHASFLAAVDDFARSFQRMVGGLAAPAAGMQLLLSPPVVLTTILVGGAGMIRSGGLAAVDLLPFLLLGLGLTAPLSALLGHGFDDVQAARRALARIRTVLGTPALPEPEHPRTPNGHRVELCSVDFRYEADHHPVLRDVDLTLEPGTVTALVGPSGSGKSTLAQLLPRFVDPDGGAVTLGGVDLRAMASSEVLRRVSFVFQEVRLLRASVAENIALARPDADRTEIVRAAAEASIHERILALPEGYDTVLGRDAVLSGGESQRLSIARALLADAPVLVLDEATAFADPYTEQAIRRAVRKAKRDRTVLVIAHRWETIADADQVIMLDRGAVVERGRPDELLARNGRFAAFWHEGAER